RRLFVCGNNRLVIYYLSIICILFAIVIVFSRIVCFFIPFLLQFKISVEDAFTNFIVDRILPLNTSQARNDRGKSDFWFIKGRITDKGKIFRYYSLTIIIHDILCRSCFTCRIVIFIRKKIYRGSARFLKGSAEPFLYAFNIAFVHL